MRPSKSYVMIYRNPTPSSTGRWRSHVVEYVSGHRRFFTREVDAWLHARTNHLVRVNRPFMDAVRGWARQEDRENVALNQNSNQESFR